MSTKMKRTKKAGQVLLTKDDVILEPYGDGMIQKMGRVSTEEELPVGTEIKIKILGTKPYLASKTSMSWVLGTGSSSQKKEFDPYCFPHEKKSHPYHRTFFTLHEAVDTVIDSLSGHLNLRLSEAKYGEEYARENNKRLEKRRRKYLKRLEKERQEHQKEMEFSRELFDWFYDPTAVVTE